MSTKQSLAVAVTLCAVVFASGALAQSSGGIALSIEKHARLTTGGAVVIAIQVACGPFPGFEEFQEAGAGAAQLRTGAEAEGGIDGTVVCDGVQRTHTARVSPFTDATFRHGPANATAQLFVCTIVADEQMCFGGSAGRRVVIRGRVVQ